VDGVGIGGGVVKELPAVGASGNLMLLRVRGSGYYAQMTAVTGAYGDARLVECGKRVLVEGDAAKAKVAAGLHLLVLHLGDLGVIFSQCYDTHHDSAAAERLAADLAAHALDNPHIDPSRVLVVVTSQYAWEGYFNSALLCERLGRCGADLDRLLAIQRNRSSWMASYSTPYVLIGIPGRRSGLRFSAFMLGAAGKKQAAEVELMLVRPLAPDTVDDAGVAGGGGGISGVSGGGSCSDGKAGGWSPVALRVGSEGAWSLALAHAPCDADIQMRKCMTAAGLAKSHAAPAPGALGLLMTTALVCLGEAAHTGRTSLHYFERIGAGFFIRV
jgi:hypothetical protein